TVDRRLQRGGRDGERCLRLLGLFVHAGGKARYGLLYLADALAGGLRRGGGVRCRPGSVGDRGFQRRDPVVDGTEIDRRGVHAVARQGGDGCFQRGDAVV